MHDVVGEQVVVDVDAGSHGVSRNASAAVERPRV
jgi:hypothetical protein